MKSFLAESTSDETKQLLKYLTITPASGELPGTQDRNSQNQTVQVALNPKKEISVKDVPVLKCQIIEPSIGEGTVIANIPIKLSVRALLSK
jgi:hydrocephalus-inducing protein